MQVLVKYDEHLFRRVVCVVLPNILESPFCPHKDVFYCCSALAASRHCAGPGVWHFERLLLRKSAYVYSSMVTPSIHTQQNGSIATAYAHSNMVTLTLCACCSASMCPFQTPQPGATSCKGAWPAMCLTSPAQTSTSLLARQSACLALTWPTW